MSTSERDAHSLLGIGGSLLMALGWAVFCVALFLLWAAPSFRGPSSVYVLVGSFGVLGLGALVQGLGFVNQTRRYGPFAGYAGMVGFIVALSAAFLASALVAPRQADSVGELGLRLFPFGVALLGIATGLVPLLAENLPSRERPAIRLTALCSFTTALLWVVVTILLLVQGPLALGAFGVVVLLVASAAAATANAVLTRFLLRTRFVEPPAD